MPFGRRCASAASVACCPLPWKPSARACHLAAAGKLCKSERTGVPTRSWVQGSDNRSQGETMTTTCCTCGSFAKEVLATAWLCSSRRCAVSSPSSISTRPATKGAGNVTHLHSILKHLRDLHEYICIHCQNTHQTEKNR